MSFPGDQPPSTWSDLICINSGVVEGGLIFTIAPGQHGPEATLAGQPGSCPLAVVQSWPGLAPPCEMKSLLGGRPGGEASGQLLLDDMTCISSRGTELCARCQGLRAGVGLGWAVQCCCWGHQALCMGSFVVKVRDPTPRRGCKGHGDESEVTAASAPVLGAAWSWGRRQGASLPAGSLLPRSCRSGGPPLCVHRPGGGSSHGTGGSSEPYGGCASACQKWGALQLVGGTPSCVCVVPSWKQGRP